MTREQPRLRRLESFPVNQQDGQVLFALRDPEGFAGSVVLPYAAAVLAALMDGTRSLADIQQAFRQRFQQDVSLADLEQLVRDLDDRLLLDTDRFRARWKRDVEWFLNSRTRPAAHAGTAYASDPAALRAELDTLFAGDGGPPSVGASRPETAGRLLGVLSPHIDLQRGGPTFVPAYRRLVEQSDAEVFVIFGTSHNRMRHLFSVSRKDFETPLGTVETDRNLAARLSKHMAAESRGHDFSLAADELAHRHEHSLEFQVVFLEYLLGGRRPYKILPVLVGSFHEMIAGGSVPADHPEVAAFVRAMRRSAAEHAVPLAYISGGDLAHIGQRFGDRGFLSAGRLQEQAAYDRELLDAAAGPDPAAFFRHVAAAGDRHRICGLSPTYTMLEVLRPTHGELLKYDQAVELDGTACVSFASMAFYGDPPA